MALGYCAQRGTTPLYHLSPSDLKIIINSMTREESEDSGNKKARSNSQLNALHWEHEEGMDSMEEVQQVEEKK